MIRFQFQKQVPTAQVVRCRQILQAAAHDWRDPARAAPLGVHLRDPASDMRGFDGQQTDARGVGQRREPVKVQRV